MLPETLSNPPGSRERPGPDFLNVEMETPASYVRFSVAIGFLDGSHLSRVGFLQPLPTLSLVDIYTGGIAKFYISSVPPHFTDEN
jgi:hypothetical protein